MNSSMARVEKLERVTQDGEVEELLFKHGLNILVGRPNTGKTVWLKMLDYVLGDRDSVERALSTQLAEKYSVIRAFLRLREGEEVVLERRWRERGSRQKIHANDHILTVDEFSYYLLPLIGIPVLHYPQGDPYSTRTWPILSWRTLFRHMYRRQDIGWGGLVERQPEGDQHACLLQFLGLASSLYSNEYGSLVNLRKERTELLARRENFTSTLNEIAQDLLAIEHSINLTPEVITNSLSDIDNSISAYLNERKRLYSTAIDRQNEESAKLLREKSNQRAELIVRHTELTREHLEAEQRQTAIKNYLDKIEVEKERLERARVAGQLFADLRITNCPACDQPISGSNDGAQECFLCRRSLPSVERDFELAHERVSVGLRQLREESAESEELKNELSKRMDQLHSELRATTERLLDIDSDIERAKQSVSTEVEERISQIDVEIGRLEERRKQWRRISDALNSMDGLSSQIMDLDNNISRLDQQVTEINAKVDLGVASSALVDGMNEYLTRLNESRPGAWSQSNIDFSLREQQFRFTVGGERWNSRLGGTLTLYFLLAYQFGLLRLSNISSFNYPGLTILDMPAELPDIEVSELENFALEPFADLFREERMEDCQMIVAGSSFENLEGANRIHLTEVFA